MSRAARALAVFDGLPLAERLFVRGRWHSAPFEAVIRRVPERGRILDVGCGHGLLEALLALDHPDRHVLGIDPDERKIAWARMGPGCLPNVELRVGVIEDLEAEGDGSFDAIVVADVLWVLPVARWPDFLTRCRRLLRPDGRLIVKEAVANRSWKYVKCLAQEQVTVRLLRRTRTSGAVNFRPRRVWRALLEDSGLRVTEDVDVSRGYSTPHRLFVGEPAH